MKHYLMRMLESWQVRDDQLGMKYKVRDMHVRPVSHMDTSCELLD